MNNGSIHAYGHGRRSAGLGGVNRDTGRRCSRTGGDAGWLLPGWTSIADRSAEAPAEASGGSERGADGRAQADWRRD